MNLLGRSFGGITVVAPTQDGAPPDFWAPYASDLSVEVISSRHNADNGLKQTRFRLRDLLPALFALKRLRRRTDLIQVRAPSNLGFLASLLLPFWHTRMFAKYAGMWPDFSGEGQSLRWQKRILQSPLWRRGLVFVYGDWPAQPPQVRSTFASVMSREALASIPRHVREPNAPTEVVFVGRLTKAKNAHVLVEALAQIGNRLPWRLTIVGGGDESERLHEQVRASGIESRVTFAGALSHTEAVRLSSRADIFVLASSSSEGWPKALAEAMMFGLACISANRGQMAEMLSNGRGLAVEPGNVGALLEALETLIADPDLRQAMGERARAFAQDQTLESAVERTVREVQAHFRPPATV